MDARGSCGGRFLVCMVARREGCPGPVAYADASTQPVARDVEYRPQWLSRDHYPTVRQRHFAAHCRECQSRSFRGDASSLFKPTSNGCSAFSAMCREMPLTYSGVMVS